MCVTMRRAAGRRRARCRAAPEARPRADMTTPQRTIDWEWTQLDGEKALIGYVWGGVVRLAMRPLDASRTTFALVFLWRNGQGETRLDTGSRRDLAAQAERKPDAIFEALIIADQRRHHKASAGSPNRRRVVVEEQQR